MGSFIKHPPKNPFRQVEDLTARRPARKAVCFAISLGLIATTGSLVYLNLLDKIPETPIEDRSPRKNGAGLRGVQSKVPPAGASESVVKVKATGRLTKTAWENEEVGETAEENQIEPEDQVTYNKRIGETKDSVRKEHEETGLREHVFGQNRTENEMNQDYVVTVPQSRGTKVDGNSFEGK